MKTVYNNERRYAYGSNVGQQDVYKVYIFLQSTTKDNNIMEMVLSNVTSLR